MRAGQVPFRTERGLDVLPVEAAGLLQAARGDPRRGVKEYYQQLYASFTATSRRPRRPTQLQFYETMPFSPRGTEPRRPGTQALDRALWVALLCGPRTGAVEAAARTTP